MIVTNIVDSLQTTRYEEVVVYIEKDMNDVYPLKGGVHRGKKKKANNKEEKEGNKT